LSVWEWQDIQKVPWKPASICSANCAYARATTIPAALQRSGTHVARDHARTEENAGRGTEAESEPDFTRQLGQVRPPISLDNQGYKFVVA
jgi:hypothetical protein